MDEDPYANSIVLQCVSIIILTLLNAYFAASEMAIVSLNKHKIHDLAQKGNDAAKLVEEILKQPTRFLSTIQVMITLSGFLNSASAATGLSYVLARYLQAYIPYAQIISMALITFLLSLFTLLFGELIPKRLAIQKSEQFAMSSAKTIYFVSKLVSPFVWFLSTSTKFILSLFNISDDTNDDKITKEEILNMVGVGSRQGILDANEVEIIDGVMRLDSSIVKDVMCKRRDMFCVDIEEDIEITIQKIMDMQYTRIPVYQGNIDQMIGILNLKDFLQEAYKQKDFYIDIKGILRKPLFVFEHKYIDDVCEQMQKQHQQIAIVIDEYGGVSGMITFEDVMEEIMGDIQDEFDEEMQSIQSIEKNRYEVYGGIPLKELEDIFHVTFPTTCDTLSGYIMEKCGRVLEDHERITIEDTYLIYDILDVKERHIKKVGITQKEN